MKYIDNISDIKSSELDFFLKDNEISFKYVNETIIIYPDNYNETERKACLFQLCNKVEKKGYIDEEDDFYEEELNWYLDNNMKKVELQGFLKSLKKKV